MAPGVLPMTATDDNLIDQNVLDELHLAMGPDAFEELCATFREQIDLVMTRLRDGARRGDDSAVAGAVHDLVGLAGTMGAPRLAAQARLAMKNVRDMAGERHEMASEIDATASATLVAFSVYCASA